uniref:gamma-glutamylcyclotransferase n=1 Tax=Eptatretus burgeri TaxID=7764 RepID=A0A8C4R481_EPTBU
MAAENTFLYFAFGSNLLRERLQMTCPSAYKVAIGRIKDYCLGFSSFSGTRNQWNGGTATILSSAGVEVWGVVWCISNNEEECLNIQEGVHKGQYSMVEVAVELDKSEPTILHCKSFKMNHFEPSYPSPQYAKVLLLGAERNALPPHYLHTLQSIKTNGSKAPVPIWDKLQSILRQSNPTTAP